jgi:hypothetical protein
MDHFENIVRLLLEKEGYWVISSFKVNLTKEEKAATGKHTIPRPEINLIAYRPKDGYVLALEVYSYLDSTGVSVDKLAERHDLTSGRFKLFTSEKYRNIVFNRLSNDLIERGYLASKIPIKLGLVAAKVKNGTDADVLDYMVKEDLFYWSPKMIKDKIIPLAKDGYENEALYIVTKILMR